MELVSYIASRIKLRDRELGKQARDLSGSVIPLSALFPIMEIKSRLLPNLKWPVVSRDKTFNWKLQFHNKIQIRQPWDSDQVVRPTCISNQVQNKSRKWRASTRLETQSMLPQVSNTWVSINLELRVPNPLICTTNLMLIAKFKNKSTNILIHRNTWPLKCTHSLSQVKTCQWCKCLTWVCLKTRLTSIQLVCAQSCHLLAWENPNFSKKFQRTLSTNLFDYY